MSDIEKAFNSLKQAAREMTVWIQDADDKEKYYEIKPDSVLGWYKFDDMRKD